MGNLKISDLEPEERQKLFQAARLRRLRKAMGVRQSEAAKAAGTSVFRWNRMEKGGQPVDSLVLERFCVAVGRRAAAGYVISATVAGLQSDDPAEDLLLKIRLQEVRERDQLRAGQLEADEAADVRFQLEQEQCHLPAPSGTKGRRGPKPRKSLSAAAA